LTKIEVMHCGPDGEPGHGYFMGMIAGRPRTLVVGGLNEASCVIGNLVVKYPELFKSGLEFEVVTIWSKPLR
jgi:hypothetical protein